MLSIPPEKIKILTRTELEELRLSITDANFDEKETSYRASFYSLSSFEYRKRMAIADSRCKSISPNNSDDYVICLGY